MGVGVFNNNFFICESLTIKIKCFSKNEADRFPIANCRVKSYSAQADLSEHQILTSAVQFSHSWSSTHVRRERSHLLTFATDLHAER